MQVSQVYTKGKENQKVYQHYLQFQKTLHLKSKRNSVDNSYINQSRKKSFSKSFSNIENEIISKIRKERLINNEMK